MSTLRTTPATAELKILGIIVKQMENLDTASQARVVEYLSARFPQFDYERASSDVSGSGINAENITPPNLLS